jgi:DNA repair ATPase RecN
VNEFHKLYFAETEISEQKEKINKEVDSLFEALKGQLDAGISPDNLGVGIEERLDAKEARLTLAATQKQLETLISLDQNIKRKLLPVLSSLQFEDMVKQILQRQTKTWNAVKKHLEAVENRSVRAQDQIELCTKIKKDCIGTQYERRAFYVSVLKETPPLDVENSENWFDALMR